MQLLFVLSWLMGATPSHPGQPITGCPPLNLPGQASAPATHPAATALVRFQLQPGLLRPQLEHLLRQHWQVENVVWYTADEHYWPTHFTLQAADWDALLEQLLAPYRLQVMLHKNHTAVVQDLPEGT